MYDSTLYIGTTIDITGKFIGFIMVYSPAGFRKVKDSLFFMETALILDARNKNGRYR